MRASTSVKLKNRSVFSIDDFGGVDFTTPPQKITNHCASFMKNFNVVGGQLRKRNGWYAEAKFPKQINGINEEAKFSGQINGIYEYAGYIYVHAGTRIYKLADGKAIDETTRFTGSPLTSDIENKKSIGFRSNGYLCICSGGKIYTSNGEIDPYIPTTTISIEATDVADPVRASHESINLLTRIRKNSILGKAGSEGSSYELDGEIRNIIEVKVNGSVLDAKKNEYSKKGKTLTIESGVTTTPGVLGEDNILVTFEAESGTWGDGEITAATVFGIDGSSDRVFIGKGGKEYISSPEGITYFPADNVISAGDITGFGKLNDGTLCIYNSNRVLYQSRTTQSKTDGEGELSYFREVFPITEGAAGVGCANPFLCHNMSTDTIIANSSGVYGINIEDGSVRTRRNTVERSYPISSKFRDISLENAHACVHNDKYYLVLGNDEGECFVADARRRYRPSESLDSNYNYEWYYYTGIPARVIASIGGKLYFGTSDGDLCVFDEEFTDRKFVYSQSGEVLCGAGSGLTVNEKFEEQERLQTNAEVYWALSNVRVNEKDPTWLTMEGNDETVKLLCEDMVVRVDKGDKSPLDDKATVFEATYPYTYTNGATSYKDTSFNYGEKYYIGDVDCDSCSFKLKKYKGQNFRGEDNDTNVYTFKEGTSGRILISPLDEVDWYDVERTEAPDEEAEDGSDEITYVYKYKFGDTLLNIGNYGGNGLPSDPVVRSVQTIEIDAVWESPIFALGSDIHLKTLDSISIAAESTCRDKLTIGYETVKNIGEFGAKGVMSFNLENLSFESFSFESGFKKSYVKRVLERNFNYIRLSIKSSGRDACRVDNIKLKYKINKNAKGFT